MMKALLVVSMGLFLGLATTACSGADSDSGADTADEQDLIVGKDVGEACTYNLQCGGSLVCRPVEPGATTNECAYVGEVGEACDENKDCMGGDPNAAHKAGTGGCKEPAAGEPKVCWRDGKGGY